MGKKKKRDPVGVKLEKLNWDIECKNDMIFGRGFEITEPAIVNKDQKSMNGIQSPRFATDWSDEDAFSERYRCKCVEGGLKGRVFEGEICPKCNCEVKFTDVDLSITGWIKLKNNYIIQPIYYNKLRAIIGKTEFPDIINYNKVIDIDGRIEDRKSSKNPFYGIGLVEFRERFDEILEYYKKKKKNMAELIAEIEEDRDNIFASCIPVYSSVLRPISFRSDSFFYTQIDRGFNSIFSTARLLNEAETSNNKRIKKKKSKKERMNVPTMLSLIQNKLMELWELVFESIDSKEGHIKSDILGGMINWSSRDVIVPDPTLRCDEVRLNYAAFLELYSYEIIACLVKIADITENEAYDQWCRAKIEYSPKIYEIMNYILKTHKPRIIINR